MRMLRLLLAVLLSPFLFQPVLSAAPPNIVLIFADDMGYGDLASYGGKIATPNLDKLAKDGVRFTQFYSPQAVCSASRAALLTGCYPNRIGIQGALPPRARIALHKNETTLAELVKTRGYATAMYGKWHLGDHPSALPTKRGFDDYYGIPYSNDMWPQHPTNGKDYPPLPMYEDDQVVELMPDQTKLTTDYTTRSVQFIEQNRDKPFFLYLAHAMPHVPLYVSDKFKGKSGHGLYGDVIQEIDWSVGEIVKTLDRLKLAENTLVIFTSDNGPWLLYGNHAGSSGPLREGKATEFEGGVRVPCIMRWPGKIKAGQECHEMALHMDIFPTIAKLTGAKDPVTRYIDGKNIWPLMRGEKNAQTPHDAMYYYWIQQLHAVRSGDWKLHLPHDYPKPTPPGSDARPGKYTTLKTGLELYNLRDDQSESNNVAAQNPAVVLRLMQIVEDAREDLGDSLTKREGKNLRPAAPVKWD